MKLLLVAVGAVLALCAMPVIIAILAVEVTAWIVVGLPIDLAVGSGKDDGPVWWRKWRDLRRDLWRTL